MHCRIADLRCKEVINVHDGLRLGFVCDILFNIDNGQILALVVPGPCKFLGIFGREDDYIIPWDCICRIGDDIILVDIKGEYRREKYGKKPWA
jgi:YlmC/YmxH family sporulation protein